MNSLLDLLHKGLTQEFSGGGTTEELIISGRAVKVTIIQFPDGTIYRDQFFTNGGGGFETFINKDGKGVIRKYAGNSSSSERLTELGLTEKEIMDFLAKVILNNALSTRLDSDVAFIEGDFRYNYSVTNIIDDPFLIIGIEEIFYKGKLVFVHTINIAELKEG